MRGLIWAAVFVFVVAPVVGLGLVTMMREVERPAEGEPIAERAKAAEKAKQFSAARQLWIEAREKGANRRMCLLGEGRCAIAVGECLHARLAADLLLKDDPLDFEATKIKDAAMACSGVKK